MELIAHGHGIGDSMVISSVAHLARAQGHTVEVSVRHPELYEWSEDVSVARGWDQGRAVAFWGVDDPGKVGGIHQVQWLATRIGLQAPVLEEIRCWMWLTAEERQLAPSGQYVTVSPFASWTQNKNWLMAQWQALVGMFAVPVQQLGAHEDPRLPRVGHSFMGAPLRHVAAVIAGAAFHVCVVTGTMHIASAVGTKSIVIYGGREDPRVTGYASDVKIFRNPGCAPCWLIEPCPYGQPRGPELDKPCMREIRICDVVDAIKEEFPWAMVC